MHRSSVYRMQSNPVHSTQNGIVLLPSTRVLRLPSIHTYSIQKSVSQTLSRIGVLYALHRIIQHISNRRPNLYQYQLRQPQP